MVTLRIVRRDRHQQLLAECLSDVIPARGEVVQLDTVDGQGEPSGPSTLWKVMGVTLLVPSLRSMSPADGSPLSVRVVEVSVIPEASLIPELASAAEVLSESRM